MTESHARRVLATFGLMLLIAAISLTAAAVNAQNDDDEHVDQFGPIDMVEMVFFPFLPHGEMIDKTGPWHGSVTIQNLEANDVRIWVFTDAGFDPDQALGTYVLPPNGSISLTAASLGVDAPGAPLVVAGVFRAIWEAEADVREHAIFDICDEYPSGLSDHDVWRFSCKPAIAGLARLAAEEPLAGATGNRTTSAHTSVDGYNAIPAQDVAWGSQSAFCDAIVSNWPGDCSGVGTYEPLGYGVGFVFDGHSYLPIVQTNSGWNTEIRISNVDPSVWAGQVNVTLIESNQQGHASGEEHQITFETILQPGESWALDLRQHGVPEGWVGSAHITSNVGVVTYAARVKPGDDMLMINVATPSTWATTSPGSEVQTLENSADYTHFGGFFEMYAPLVFRDYFGWNTGVSIANIDEATNQVFITWYDSSGVMRGTDVRTIPPKGQVYVYLPGMDKELSGRDDGWVGSVILSSDRPFHATIDQVKYETGEAMSYMATAAGARAPDNSDAPELSADTLALPLMQKGLPDGSGDTSGIQLFNPDLSDAIEIEIWFYSPVGDLLPPTIAMPIRTTILPRSHYTFYSMSSSSMIPNTTGTAVVHAVGGNGRVYGVSNAVNYAVEGDGSAAFNLVNSYGQYRFPVSQTELP